MSDRKKPITRKYRMDMLLNEWEREFVARMSWDMGMSMAEYLRSGRVPSRQLALMDLKHLRRKQKGIKGIVEGIRR